MDLLWAIASISKPYMPLSSFSFDSIVFKIAIYLAQFHRFSIVIGIGMIWISPIPIPYDPSPSVWKCYVFGTVPYFPYHPRILPSDMGMFPYHSLIY